MAKPAKKATSRRFGKGSTARANKNALTSKEGLNLLKKASARTVSDIKSRTKPPSRLKGKISTGAPGAKEYALLAEGRYRYLPTKTKSVRLVPRGSGGMRGGAGGGGILGSKIR